MKTSNDKIQPNDRFCLISQMNISKEDIWQLAYKGYADRVRALLAKNIDYLTKRDEVRIARRSNCSLGWPLFHLFRDNSSCDIFMLMHSDVLIWPKRGVNVIRFQF